MLYAEEPIKHLYLGNDTHTDLMWNGDEDEWYRYNLDMAKFYLRLGESTMNNPPESRSKWNYDVSWTLYMVEQRASKELFDRLIAQIKNGQASVPYNFVSAVYGASTLESTLRSFYYGGYLERTYEIPVELAIAQENATLPLGLASLWAGSGAKYSWKGVCNCATKINTVGERDQEIYWYTGLDGRNVLMKWYSNYGWNAELGGYAEMLEPTVAVQQMNALCDTERYPFLVAGAFGKGWDNIHNYAYDLVWGLGHRTLPGTKLHLSNQLDFFHHFEKEYGSDLPNVALAHGNEWDLNLASLAEVNATFRRSMEKLRTAEAMAAFVSIGEPDRFDDLQSLKTDFYYGLGVFNVHGWTADGPIDRHDFATYMRRQQQKVTDYVDVLYSQAAKALAENVFAEDNNIVYLFNPLNWDRDELIDIPADGPMSVWDKMSDKRLESVNVTKNSQNYIRVLVKDIPPVGYKLLQLIEGNDASDNVPFTVSGQEIETPFYKVQLTKSGAIRSLYDKTIQKEWTKGLLNYLDNRDPKAGEDMEVLFKDNHCLTILCRSEHPVKHDCRITLYAHTPRIDIQNRILENFDDPLHWSFDFRVDKAEVWHEEVGAIIKAKTALNGGHYADRMARYDYLTLNHFLNVGNNRQSITLSNRDCLFFRLGDSTPTFLDQQSATVHVLAGGQVNDNLGVIAQDGDSLFHQDFSVMPHHYAFDAAISMRLALEHQNPVVVEPVTPGGKWVEKNRSLLKIEMPDVILWTLKPAEDAGLIARMWNLNPAPVLTTVECFKGIKTASIATHVETDIDQLESVKNTLSVQLNQQQLQTMRLVLEY